MDSLALHSLLTALTWLLLTLLLLLLLLIARFFERLSGKRTHYRLLLLPILCFTGAAVQVAGAPEGDPFAYALAFVGGSILSVFCFMLYRKMTLR